MRIVLSLRHEKKWIAENNEFRVEGENLEELDSNLKAVLRTKGYRGRVEVLMKFDYSTIPHWMRQFHPHYFNRRVIFEIS